MAINVGDLVRITDTRQSYSDYPEMFQQLGFRSDERRDNPYRVGDVLRVFQTMLVHPDGTTLYGLEHQTTIGCTQILMNQRGIELVFPKHWHIKVTEENNEMLGSWREAGQIDGLEGIILSEYVGTRGYWIFDESSIPHNCQTEITTEQFKQFVLNQPPTNMPIETTTPEQQYAAAMAAMDLQIGDTVRIVCSTPDGDRGWRNVWDNGAMDTYIGAVGEVTSIRDNNMGIQITNTNGFNFPIYSLELVRRANVTPTPEPTTNLENEQEDAVITTKERVICLTDKWNYVTLGEVYEVIKRDEYYTYVKDSIGGESRYAHHYFEDWVDAETKAKRDSFKALFGDHSTAMFKNASDDVQRLMAQLYPRLYEYNGWINLKKESNQDSKWLFEGLGIRLITEEDTTNERLHGTIRFDHSDYILDTFTHQGYTHIRFRKRF